MDQYIAEDRVHRAADSQWKLFITQAVCLCDMHVSGVMYCTERETKKKKKKKNTSCAEQR